MTLTLKVPENIVLKPQITVFGVGGAGCNATNNMITQNLEGVTFVVANTDAQALEHSGALHKIQLGQNTTRGLGAGANPNVGREAAEEAEILIRERLEGSNMVFITAGMGGGTGTGSASVVAKIAREMGVLTVAVVTKPFHFEGAKRMRIAEEGLSELQKFVDTLIVIPNQNLFRVANEKTTFGDAFKMADNVLHSGVRGITDLMVMPGLINLDFADVRSVMGQMGKAMMGTGEASGEGRALKAAEAAIANPLLDNVSMKGAKGVLINITGGSDMTLFEVDEAANRIRQEVDDDANIIFGSAFNDELEGSIRVSIVATGIDGVAGYNINTASKSETSQEVASEEVVTEDSIEASSIIDEAESTILEPISFDFGVDASSEAYSATSDDAASSASENNSFYAADAVEPENFQEELLGSTNHSASFSEKFYDPDLNDGSDFDDEKPTRPAKKGLFSKVASVARSLQSGADYNVKVNSGKVIAANDEKDSAKQNLLDVPAFMRRKVE